MTIAVRVAIVAAALGIVIYAIGVAIDGTLKPTPAFCVAGDSPGSRICVK